MVDQAVTQKLNHLDFELRKARRWPWLAALAVIILLAIAFWWWRGHTQSKLLCCHTRFPCVWRKWLTRRSPKN
jgi:flagellar biosynthesis/type III secretory pathway M-ring protein FliF/YscJ